MDTADDGSAYAEVEDEVYRQWLKLIPAAGATSAERLLEGPECFTTTRNRAPDDHMALLSHEGPRTRESSCRTSLALATYTPYIATVFTRV